MCASVCACACVRLGAAVLRCARERCRRWWRVRACVMLLFAVNSSRLPIMICHRAA
jgi:hypothetical protein